MKITKQYCGNPEIKHCSLPVAYDVNFASHSEKVRAVPLYTATPEVSTIVKLNSYVTWS
jgi:hypothetical protein